MKMHTRKKMEAAGVIKKAENAAVKAAVSNTGKAIPPEYNLIESYDALAEEVYATVQQEDDEGCDQRQLIRDFKEKGYAFEDIGIAIAILQRQKKIVFLG